MIRPYKQVSLDGGGWSTPRPGRPTPGKTRYPLYRRLGGPQVRSGRVRKISPPPGFDPPKVQPVASRCANLANPAHVCIQTHKVTFVFCWASYFVRKFHRGDYTRVLIRSKCACSNWWRNPNMENHQKFWVIDTEQRRLASRKSYYEPICLLTNDQLTD
jgi:hypothetical protein